jgi:hypothetical protein
MPRASVRGILVLPGTAGEQPAAGLGGAPHYVSRSTQLPGEFKPVWKHDPDWLKLTPLIHLNKSDNPWTLCTLSKNVKYF